MRSRVAAARVGRLATLTSPAPTRAAAPGAVLLRARRRHGLLRRRRQAEVDARAPAPRQRARPPAVSTPRRPLRGRLVDALVGPDRRHRRRRRADGERAAGLDALQAKYEQYRRQPPPGRCSRSRSSPGAAGPTMTARTARPTKTRGMHEQRRWHGIPTTRTHRAARQRALPRHDELRAADDRGRLVRDHGSRARARHQLLRHRQPLRRRRRARARPRRSSATGSRRAAAGARRSCSRRRCSAR